MAHDSAIRRKEILPFLTCMDLEGIRLSKISQIKTSHVIHLYVESKIKQTNPKLREKEVRCVVSKSWGWGWGVKMAFQVSWRKVLCSVHCSGITRWPAGGKEKAI